MIFFRFKTRSSYFFPYIDKKHQFIYSLYGNYGGRITQAYWSFFRSCAPFRWLHAKSSDAIDHFSEIEQLLGSDMIYGINMGTPGPEQKKSILGYNKKTEAKFFAKFATKEDAIKLSKNEIKVYQTLAKSALVPQIYDYKITQEYVYLNCECIDGEHISEMLSEEEVLDILNTLKEYHYNPNETNKYELKTCFAHNDFCLWNMLRVNGKVRLIDWEMASEFPLGHDLFTYIFQNSFFIWNAIPTIDIYNNSKSLINKYFGELDFRPYLIHFVEYKLQFFSKGQNEYALKRYEELKDLINTLYHE